MLGLSLDGGAAYLLIGDLQEALILLCFATLFQGFGYRVPNPRRSR